MRRALPDHRYSQEELAEAVKALWADKLRNTGRIESFHRAVQVAGRHLALPIDAYRALKGFGESNDAFIDVGLDLVARAARAVLDACDVPPREVDHIFFTSVTGVAVPSLDARLQACLPFGAHVRRTPLFGLGCAGGAACVARATDYLRAYPRQVALLLSVELCSLTLQRADLSAANLVASGLFGDAAAAVLIAGAEHPLSARAAETRTKNPFGPAVIASRPILYPDTEALMGWRVSENGFGLVLSPEVPEFVRECLGGGVRAFLRAEGRELEDVTSFVLHPGGPKVLAAMKDALGLEGDELALSEKNLEQVGNVSSASVLLVLEDTIRERRPETGSYGLLGAMGPGFAAELALLEW